MSALSTSAPVDDSLPVLPNTFYAISPLSIGHNSFLRIGSSLMALLPILKNIQPPDSEQLKRDILHELQQFKRALEQLSFSSTIILAAEYCLCTALDEAILTAPWSGESDWGEQTLLSLRYHETLGGEKFYIILDRLLESKDSNAEILEFLHALLSLGFVGKYYNQDKSVIHSIKYHLFQRITASQPPCADEKKLIPLKSWRQILKNYALLDFWVLPLLTVFIIVMAYFVFEYDTRVLIQPTLKQLDMIKKTPPPKF